MKKIGLFGGTFNPFHIGHFNVLKLIQEKYNFDFIYLIPTYITPGKQSPFTKIDPRDKIKMLEIFIKKNNISWLKLLKFEYKKKGISYTYLTIKHLKEKFSSSTLFFIIGNDILPNLNSWNNIDYIKNNVTFLIVKRIEINKTQIIDLPSKFFINNKVFDYSSTEILKNKQWEKIPLVIRDYISKKHLYLNELVLNSMSHERFEHSLSVAVHAKRLAKKNFYFNSNTAYITGLIHDLFKEFDLEKIKSFLDKKFISENKIPNQALHGFVASKWLKEIYGLKNKQVLSAIEKHTLANKNMSKLDKIIYVADKIANNRLDKDSFRFRRMAYKDLNKTFIKILENQIQIIKHKNLEPHLYTLESLKKYKEKEW